MSDVHKCRLPIRNVLDHIRLPPTASRFRRFARKFRRHTIINPDNFGCKNYYLSQSAILAEQRKHLVGKYCYIIHPFSNLYSVLQVSVFVIWLFRMCYLPLISSMMSTRETLHRMDHISAFVVQPMIIISFFFVGYIDDVTGNVVLEQRKIVFRYLKTFFFFDLIATELLDPKPLLKGYIQDDVLITRIELFFDLLGVLCLYVRLNTIMSFLDNTGQMLRLSNRFRRCMCLLVKTGLYLHLFSCVLYMIPYIVYPEEWPKDSWLVVAEIHPTSGASIERMYGECLLMTVCNFFGASEGKYDVDQTNEQIAISFVGFFGRLYTLFLLADILRMFGIVDVSESSYESHLAQLQNFMDIKRFPALLKARMVRYFKRKFHNRYFNEKAILDGLSDRLREELCLFSAKELIKKSQLLGKVPKQDLAVLISKMRQETFMPGHVLFSPGDDIDDAFFIASGSVAIFTSDGWEMCHLKDGEIFGLIRRMLRADEYVAVVLEVTEMFIISIQELRLFVQAFPEAKSYIEVMNKARKIVYERLAAKARKRNMNLLDDLEGDVLERRDHRFISRR